MNSLQCPLIPDDNEVTHSYLSSLSLDDLIFVTEQISSQLSSDERMNYDVSRFCSEYADHAGRIRFVKALVDDSIIAPVQIPSFYEKNPSLLKLVRAPVFEYFLPEAQAQADTTSALTDAIEAVTTALIKVTNPRWEHGDDTRKAASPDIAAVGDIVKLTVDISGYPDGAPVVFDIFDASGDPAMRIDTVRGKNEGGVSTVSWTVSDPNEAGPNLKLEFEGSARSKSSGKAPIDLEFEKIYRVEVKDDEGNLIEGIKVEFSIPGKEPVVVKTDKNGIAEQPADDPAVDADVRILWEEKPEEPESDEVTPASGGYEVFLVNDDKKPMADIKVCFEIDGVKTILPTDEKGRAFLEAKAGSTGIANVSIVKEGTPLADADADPDSIQITVLDENDVPVEGAEVTFTIDGEDHMVMSDTNGLACFKHEDAEEAIVTIKKPASAKPDPSPHAAIRTRALTDDQVREALQYHVDQGDITLTEAKVPETGKRVSLSADVVAGVTIMQLVDPFARGAEKPGDAPGQKHERDKFSCKPLTAYHRSLLNQRHALGIVRLCKNWLIPNGFKVMYTQGMNGDTSRKDCHGWGTALDFGGASKELPTGTANCTVRLGTDFIVYLHWGLIPMWKPETVSASSSPDDWERLASWTIDDKTDFTKNPPGKKLHYRLDPPPYQKAENGKEPLSAVKEHFQNASTFFKNVAYKFAVEEYSDATADLGAGVPNGPTTEIDSHSGHFVLHPDYPKPNEASSKYGRNAHNNHLHLQLGKTNYDTTA